MKLVIKFEQDYNDEPFYGSFNNDYKGIPVPTTAFNYEAHRNLPTTDVTVGRKRVYAPTFIASDGTTFTPTWYYQPQWKALLRLDKLAIPIYTGEASGSRPYISKKFCWGRHEINGFQYHFLEQSNSVQPDRQANIGAKYTLHLQRYGTGIDIPEWLALELGRGKDAEFTIKKKYVTHADITQQVTFWDPGDNWDAKDVAAAEAVREPLSGEDEEDVYCNLDKDLPEQFQFALKHLIAYWNDEWSYMCVSATLWDAGNEVDSAGYGGCEVGHDWRSSDYVFECINDVVAEVIADHDITGVVLRNDHDTEELNWDKETRKVVM